MKNTTKMQIELIKKDLKKHSHNYFIVEVEESDIYAEKELEQFIANDLINTVEEGFMVGYLAA